MLKIKIEKFEGPLGLLLKLIEKEELDITQISLAKIADQYVVHITNMSDINPGEMADFLVVAAKLLLIKSKALLPFIYPEEEEEIKELELQLRMYKEFLQAMKKVQAIIGKKKFMFAREFNRRAVLANVDLFSPPKKLKIGDLAAVFEGLVKNIKAEQKLLKLEEEQLDYKINIEEKITAIKNLLLNKIKISFSKVLADSSTKTEVIVSFLAMLELIKQKDVMVVQNNLFGEIEINRI